MGVKHLFVSTVEDEPAQTDRVRPSDWNEDHIIDSDIDMSPYKLTVSTVIRAYTQKDDDYTVLATDYDIEVTVSGKTITLLTAVGRAGQEFRIDNSSNGDITVDTVSSQTIQGELTQTVPTDSDIVVVSNGTNWRIK